MVYIYTYTLYIYFFKLGFVRVGFYLSGVLSDGVLSECGYVQWGFVGLPVSRMVSPFHNRLYTPRVSVFARTCRRPSFA